MTANLVLRHKVVAETRRYFDSMDFVEVETPILTRSTPEGARDFLVPSRIHKGSFYALPQSPQLFKQLLQVAGLGRYVQIARCFRDEDLRADRQPEFTQVDVEASFVTEEDIFLLVEGLFRRIFPLVGIEPPADLPSPRICRGDGEIRLRSARHALRSRTCGAGRPLRGLRVQGSGRCRRRGPRQRAGVCRAAPTLSRKQLDALSEFVKPYGAAGVLWFKRTPDGVASPAKKALGDDGVSEISRRRRGGSG